MYEMTLDKSVHEEDRVFEQEDFVVAISKDFDGSYSGLVVDYVKSFLGKGFTISDKGKHSSCC